jgi:hypothetical protein
MVMSHFPLFHTQTAANANMSAAHYIGDERMGEYDVDGTRMKFEPCPKDNAECETVAQFQARRNNALQVQYSLNLTH